MNLPEAISRNKKDVFILCLLLLFLIVPRVLIYPVLGSGIVGTDAEFRYFPQAVELSESFSHFFSQTGPAYSAFLLFFKEINNDMVTVPVIIQHILGVITALMVFYYFRKVNLSLAFIVTLFTYCSWLALWLEHTILRDAFAAFFSVLLVLLVSFVIKNRKYSGFTFGFLAGLTALILIFIRVEFLALFVLMPLILFVAKKREQSDFKLGDKMFLKWIVGYICPLLAICIVYTAMPKNTQIGTSYGSVFNIAYHGLLPDVFYYGNSRYPDLLKEYQTVLEANNGKVSESMWTFYGVTEKYLSGHPEIKLSVLQIMDKVYVDMMIKNTPVYLKSFVINLKNQLFGIAELNTLVHKNKITEMSDNKIAEGSFLYTIFRDYNIGMVFLHLALFWLFLPSLVFLAIKWRTLPIEIIIAFFVSLIHIFVLAFFSNPAHRFRYPIDPFLYFLQLYLILILLKTVFLKPFKFVFSSKNEGAKNEAI